MYDTGQIGGVFHVRLANVAAVQVVLGRAHGVYTVFQVLAALQLRPTVRGRAALGDRLDGVRDEAQVQIPRRRRLWNGQATAATAAGRRRVPDAVVRDARPGRTLPRRVHQERVPVSGRRVRPRRPHRHRRRAL